MLDWILFGIFTFSLYVSYFDHAKRSFELSLQGKLKSPTARFYTVQCMFQIVLGPVSTGILLALILKDVAKKS